MIVLSRRCPCFRSIGVCLIILGFLLVGYHGFALQPALNHAHMRHTRSSILIRHEIRRGIRSDTTKIALTEETSIDATASSCIHNHSGMLLSFDGPDFGGLATGILGIGLVASVGAFVYANIVYTPEILEGAKDIRRSERDRVREAEIQKLLNAVQSHEKGGNDIAELRVPLETALGKTLEDYVRAVLEPGSDDNDSLFTASDTELATILKQSL